MSLIGPIEDKMSKSSMKMSLIASVRDNFSEKGLFLSLKIRIRFGSVFDTKTIIATHER